MRRPRSERHIRRERIAHTLPDSRVNPSPRRAQRQMAPYPQCQLVRTPGRRHSAPVAAESLSPGSLTVDMVTGCLIFAHPRLAPVFDAHDVELNTRIALTQRIPRTLGQQVLSFKPTPPPFHDLASQLMSVILSSVRFHPPGIIGEALQVSRISSVYEPDALAGYRGR